jgi:CDP-paratose 2-epimerase
MSVVIVTGSAGLVGSETSRFFHDQGFDVVGIDNDMRSYFFGAQAGTGKTRQRLEKDLPRYRHEELDVRSFDGVDALFKKYGRDISLVVHAAGQPSHDWAAKEPLTDFAVNANGTLNVLEACRKHCPDAVFIFTSTNKVYGDLPNFLPLVEMEKRWEVAKSHSMAEHGIDETMSIDQSKHSIFGVGKVAADVMVQEYARYFGMKTGVFRGGCLTGPAQAGAELHGFLAYLVLCAVRDKHYTIYGYKGKQVRDNIHSRDLVSAFWHFFREPRGGTVYNIGGSRFANISMLEAIEMIERLGGGKLPYSLSDQARSGDHLWYVSDVRRFQKDYPKWKYTYTIEQTLKEMIEAARSG